MRVALAPEGTRGDVFPMLELGAWLAGRGHAVRICAPPDFGPAARARGLAFRPVGRPVAAHLRAHARALVRGGLSMARASDRFLREEIAAHFRDLDAALEGCDHVVGAGIQLAAPSVAERHGIPYRYVLYCPQVLPSRHHPPFVVERQTLPPYLNRVAWWAVRRLFGAVIARRLDRERVRLGLPPVGDAYLHMSTTRPLLAADPVLADPPDDASLPVDRMPCLHPVAPGALPAKLEAFLEAGPPPIYLGFGSMTDPRPERTTRIVREAAAQAGLRVVLGRGWAGLGDAPLTDDVFVADEVCHPALFPRVAAVVHHGGAGTSTTAARAGVPQVVVPHVLDQFWWGERLRRLGVAPPPLPRRRLGARALAERLALIRDSDLLAARARELTARMDDARPDPESLGRVLEPL